MRLVAPRQRRNFPEDDVGAGHADVLEEMIAKFGQASLDLAFLAPPLPVPEQHGSEAECDKEDCTTECGTPRGDGSADRHKMRAGHRGARGSWAQAASATAGARAIPLAGVLPAAGRPGPFVALRQFATMRTTVMDHAPVGVGARLGAVLAGLISALRAARHIVSVLKQMTAGPT